MVHPFFRRKKMALSLQRCCKNANSAPHAGREREKNIALAQRGAQNLYFCNTPAAGVQFFFGTLAAEVLQSTKIALPRWARVPKNNDSRPAWECDFRTLQHLCSESASFAAKN